MCALIEFVHLDKLEWGQVEELFLNEKLQGWFYQSFPARLGHDLIKAVNTRMIPNGQISNESCQTLETEMRQKISGIQAESEVWLRSLQEELKALKDTSQSPALHSNTDSRILESIDFLKQRASASEEHITELWNRVGHVEKKLTGPVSITDSCISKLMGRLGIVETDRSETKRQITESVNSLTARVGRMEAAASEFQKTIVLLAKSISDLGGDLNKVKIAFNTLAKHVMQSSCTTKLVIFKVSED